MYVCNATHTAICQISYDVRQWINATILLATEIVPDCKTSFAVQDFNQNVSRTHHGTPNTNPIANIASSPYENGGWITSRASPGACKVTQIGEEIIIPGYKAIAKIPCEKPQRQRAKSRLPFWVLQDDLWILTLFVVVHWCMIWFGYFRLCTLLFWLVRRYMDHFSWKRTFVPM